MSELIPIGMVPTFHARRDPNRPMVTSGGITLSRSELDARANRRARALAAQGVGQGDFVTMFLPNCVEFFETTFALWKLGATPQPLSALMPEKELRAIVDLVRPKLIVGTEAARIEGYPTMLGLAPIDESLSAEPLPECTPDYWRATTSGGSTGRPKVIISHGYTMVDPLQGSLQRIVDGVQLNPGPLYHGGPFSASFGGMFHGAHLVDGGKFDPLNVLTLIDKHKVDWLYLVPTMMNRIWQLPQEQRLQFDLSSLRVVFHMASACPIWLKQGWIDWLGPDRIWELYSGTESQGVTMINGREWLDHKGSVGRVMPSSELLILDADGKEKPQGEVGEIFFLPKAGRGATYHYIGAEATSVGDWESLGDLGHVDKDGYLYVADRRTDLIVSGGVNVYPAEVEAALDAHPSIECSVVVGLPDDDLGHRVHALVTLRPDRERPSEDDFRNFLAGHLTRYKIPKTFEFLAGPLRDETGKVRRSALREERIRKLKPREELSEMSTTTAPKP